MGNDKFHSSERTVQTCIPSAIEMSVREVDWHRLYRCVKAIPKPTSRYQTLASFFFGISASAFVSLIPLYQTTMELDYWIKPAFWGAAGISLFIGALLLHFSNKHESMIEVNCESIKKDMKDVYMTFFHDKDLEKEAE
ncbi:TPA: hypothetical protein P0E23_005245 [Vibrio harveyi]|nr:hypothetical protein [Vibrio harveyi]